jgi:hypothetical protein
MKTTEITVELYPNEIEKLLNKQRKSVEWRGLLPIVIKVGDNEQKMVVPYQINIVMRSDNTVNN